MRALEGGIIVGKEVKENLYNEPYFLGHSFIRGVAGVVKRARFRAV